MKEPQPQTPPKEAYEAEYYYQLAELNLFKLGNKEEAMQLLELEEATSEASPLDANSALVAAMMGRLKEAIESKETVCSLSVEYLFTIGGRILPTTQVYKIVGYDEAVYVIDGLSRYGSLSLINIQALRDGDHSNLYVSGIGTYDRDENMRLTTIHLDIVDNGIDSSQMLFGEADLAILLEDQTIFQLGKVETS